MTEAVVIVGAGAAGLATAASLLRRGVKPLVLDRGERVGQSWAERYDRLHLHTARVQSQLPGLPIPRAAGPWVSRDDFVTYLQAYAAHCSIPIRFGVEVDAVHPVDAGHRVTGTDRSGVLDVTARHVVLATGLNRVPRFPDWPGAESYTGQLLHASRYRNAEPYGGRDVLVVGIGNSGAEIAADLAESFGQRADHRRRPRRATARGTGSCPGCGPSTASRSNSTTGRGSAPTR